MLRKVGSAEIRRALRVLAFAIAIFVVVLVIEAPRNPAKAAVPSVVINEIMYNPQSGLDGDEFIELYNTTGGSVDLSGWCFTAGVTLCFDSGTTLASHAYGLVSSNAAQTLSKYGKTTIGTYTGKLDNGGERITLKDASLTIINDLVYDDITPWPISPDGTGHSLELRDPSLDNTLAASWTASNTLPTPGVVNSTYGVSLPVISNTSKPTGVQPSTSVTITAQIENATSVTMNYKIMFGSDVTVTMYDDGAHGDGASGDNVYGASIPGQAAGDLVRYNISATNTDGTSTSPSSDDSLHYYGYVPVDAGVTSAGQVLRWYIDDTNYNALLTTGIITNGKYPCVFVYGDEVFDSSQIRIKGNNTRGFDKHSFKGYLPAGYTVKPVGAANKTSEFHLNADYRAEAITKVPTIWWVAKQAGLPTPSLVTTRLMRNNQFEGMYNYFDKYQKQWRVDNGYEDGTLYEELGVNSGTGTVGDLTTWISNLSLDTYDPAKRDFLLTKNNIPNILDYMSFTALTRSADQAMARNSLQYHDNGTDRWSLLAWDQDLTLIQDDPRTYASPYDLYSSVNNSHTYLTAFYEQPDIRQAYYRRLRTLVDKLYSQNQLVDKYNDLYNQFETEISEDNAKWPSGLRSTKAFDLTQFSKQKNYLLSYLRQAWALPAAQTDLERQAVQIDDANTSVDTANQFIKLVNSSDSAVDISGWTVEELGYTIPQGSVIPGHGTMYLVRNDVGYKATHAAVMVAGQFGQDMGLTGLVTLKTETGTEIDSHVY